MEFKPLKRESIANQIAEELKQKIISGEFKAGDKLPSENEFRNIYGISHTAIRQALNTLAAQGLIETRQGEGSYVKKLNIEEMMSGIVQIAVLQSRRLPDTFEFRYMYEPRAAYIACQKATDADIQTLKNIYAQMQKCQNDGMALMKAECDFHKALITVSGNSYAIKINETLNASLLAKMPPETAEVAVKLGLQYYDNVIEAMKKRDPDLVEQCMKEHFEAAIFIMQSKTE